MAQAARSYSTDLPTVVGIVDRSVPLSVYFRDPLVRHAFERSERDDGAAFALPAPKPAPVPGGAVKVLEDA